MPIVLVEAIEKDKPDAAGVAVCEVYARRPPRYAVYRTSDRVLIHFADDETIVDSQRTALAPLNPLRGEINGLIDTWRSSSNPPLQMKAKGYDRRVADALIFGLDQDVGGAVALLAEIKKDIIEERTSWARFHYLMMASAVAAIAVALSCWLGNHDAFDAESRNLWIAAGTGAVGAFFSIAIGIRNRTVLTDLRQRDNSLDALLRIVIGSIAAVVLIALVLAKAVSFDIGGAKLVNEPVWLYILIVAFVGGFSERLVPDLLAKAAAEPSDASKLASTTMASTPASPPSSAKTPVAISAVPTDASDQAHGPDCCLSGTPIEANEATPDTELPQASGGIAASRRDENA